MFPVLWFSIDQDRRCHSKAQHTLAESTAHLKHISEAGNLNYSMSEYAAYFSYTIIQISHYSNMLQMCRALSKCVPRLKETYD